MVETLTARIIAYMKEHGYVEQLPRLKRYRVFKVNIPGEVTRTYFVGSAGAVRCSKTGKIGDAYSVSDIFRKYVDLWELKQLAVPAVLESIRDVPRNSVCGSAIIQRINDSSYDKSIKGDTDNAKI